MTKEKINILFAAGGTGGHLFPAIAVAEELDKQSNGNCQFHFVGTENKIEARVVPQLGYNLHTIKLAGLTKSLKTLLVPYQVLSSILKCKKIIKENSISAVVCAGAYLSYPPGLAASMLGVPLFLMESNVNPGKAIKMLSSKATRIITTFEESKKFFPQKIAEKIITLGNPIRGDILSQKDKIESRRRLDLPIDSKNIFVFGGSLGARSINNAIANHLDEIAEKNYYIVWQTGKNFQAPSKLPGNVRMMTFVDDMASYYSAADLVIARSGATTVAEICIVGVPSILVPLPSASNNEQMHNANILQNNNATITVNDSSISVNIINLIDEIINDDEKLSKMGLNAKQLAKPNAASDVAKLILNFINND